MGKQLLRRNDTRRIYLMITWILIHGCLATQIRKRAVPVYGNQASAKGNNSNAALDEWRKYWHEKNGGLCDPGHVPHRNNTVCCLVTVCGPGYEIEECNHTGSSDSCKKCDPGYLQMNNISSLDIGNAKCFEKVYNHDICPIDDQKPARKIMSYNFPLECECQFENCYRLIDDDCDHIQPCMANYQMNRKTGCKCTSVWDTDLILPVFSDRDIRPAKKNLIPSFGYPCECRFEECYKPDDVGTCDLQPSCNSNEQMNRTSGICERCPPYTYKNKTGCEPCTFNVTLLLTGPDEHYARVTETSTTVSTVTEKSTSDHVELLSTSATSPPSGLNLNVVVAVVAAVVLLLAMIVCVIVYLFKRHRNSSSSPTSPSRETAPLMDNQLTEITTPTNNVELSFRNGLYVVNGQPNGLRHMYVHANGQPNGIQHMNGHANGQSIGIQHMNGHANGQPNGIQHMNGHTNGQPNGLQHMNGHANGQPNGLQHMNVHANGQPNGLQHMNVHANGQPNGIPHMNGHANGMQNGFYQLHGLVNELPGPNGFQNMNGVPLQMNNLVTGPSQNRVTPVEIEELQDVGNGEPTGMLVHPCSECRENAAQENDLNQKINHKEHLKLLQAKQSKALSLPPERNIQHSENSDVESTKRLNLTEEDIEGAIGHTTVNISCKTCGSVNQSVDCTDINVEEDQYIGEPKPLQTSKKNLNGNTRISFHNNNFSKCNFILNRSRKNYAVLEVCREGSGSFDCSGEDTSESLEVAHTMDNERGAERSIESVSGLESGDRVNVPACRPELSRNCSGGPPAQQPDQPSGFGKATKRPVVKVAPMTRQTEKIDETHVSGHPSGGLNYDSTQPSSSLSYALGYNPDNAHSSARPLDIANFQDFSSMQSEHLTHSDQNGTENSTSLFYSPRDDQFVPPPDGSLTRRKQAGDPIRTGITLPNRIDTGPGINPARVANVRPEMEELKVVSLPSRDSDTCLKQMENDSGEESSFELKSEEVQKVIDNVETDKDCNDKSQQQLGPTCGDEEQEESFELLSKDLQAGETSDLDTEEAGRNVSTVHNEDNSGVNISHTAESTENTDDDEESFEIGTN